jgi:hypothetical protein
MGTLHGHRLRAPPGPGAPRTGGDIAGLALSGQLSRETANGPPYAVFELTPTTVVGLPGIAGTEEGAGSAGSFNPTRWRF